MSAGSTLDPDAGLGSGGLRPPGHDTGSLGPSDVSDTGSDSVGPGGYDEAILGEDGDSVGTGVDPAPYEANRDEDGADIGFDRIVGAGEAGLGGGLDQAEEARYGVTDEELDPVDEAGASLDPSQGPQRGLRTTEEVRNVRERPRTAGWGEAGRTHADRVDVIDDGASSADGDEPADAR